MAKAAKGKKGGLGFHGRPISAPKMAGKVAQLGKPGGGKGKGKK